MILKILAGLFAAAGISTIGYMSTQSSPNCASGQCPISQLVSAACGSSEGCASSTSTNSCATSCPIGSCATSCTNCPETCEPTPSCCNGVSKTQLISTAIKFEGKAEAAAPVVEDKIDYVALCRACAKECAACAKCCKEENRTACTKTCETCSALCTATANLVEMNSALATDAKALCAKLCKECAELCEKQTDACCKKCAKTCKECATKLTK
ncbi:MAG: hypothetical protein ACRCZF_05685 [Gemmataceae bacterium]